MVVDQRRSTRLADGWSVSTFPHIFLYLALDLPDGSADTVTPNPKYVHRVRRRKFMRRDKRLRLDSITNRFAHRLNVGLFSPSERFSNTKTSLNLP